jgi:hypothetical protein
MRTIKKFAAVLFVAALLLVCNQHVAAAERVTITTSPQTARVYVNGVQMGTGKVEIKVSKNDCLTVEVKQEGYIGESRTYCVKKGMADPPSTDYIQLQEDESYTSSIESNIANTEIQINVNPNKSREDAWKQVVSTVLDKFDVLENSDEKADTCALHG